MSRRQSIHPTGPQKERAMLVGVAVRGSDDLWDLDESLDELAELANAAGANAVSRVTQRLNRPSPVYLGTGKLETLNSAVRTNHIDTVIFDDELTPTQQRALETQAGGQGHRPYALILMFLPGGREPERATADRTGSDGIPAASIGRQWSPTLRGSAVASERGGPAKRRSRPTGVSCVASYPGSNASWTGSEVNALNSAASVRSAPRSWFHWLDTRTPARAPYLTVSSPAGLVEGPVCFRR